MAADSSRIAIPAFGTKGRLWLGLLAAIMVAGLAAWGYQLTTGLVATGMRNVFSWGLYIMMFVLFVGLSAGGLIISSAPKFFHSHRYEGFARLGVLVSLACITVAGLLILPDIGRPERLYQFFTSPDFRSPMVWDFGIVILYGVLNLWYLWLLTRRDLAARGSRLALGVADTDAGRERDRTLMFWTAALALPTAVALHSVTGWIFATQIGRGDWFSPSSHRCSSPRRSSPARAVAGRVGTRRPTHELRGRPRGTHESREDTRHLPRASRSVLARGRATAPRLGEPLRVLGHHQ